MKDKLAKISQLYFGDDEDKQLATDWLISLVGKDNAEANILVMEIYATMEDDSNIVISSDTFATMKFTTYKTNFGKNYRYEVYFDYAFKGDGVSYSRDFSRYQVGDGEPKDELITCACRNLRKRGFELYNDLYINMPKVEQ